VMKGIGNYVCLRRLAEYQRQLTFATSSETARVLDWAGRSKNR